MAFDLKLHECVSNSTSFLDEIVCLFLRASALIENLFVFLIEMWYAWPHPLSHLLLKDIFGGSKPWSRWNLQYSLYRDCSCVRKTFFDKIDFKVDLMSIKYWNSSILTFIDLSPTILNVTLLAFPSISICPAVNNSSHLPTNLTQLWF